MKFLTLIVIVLLSVVIFQAAQAQIVVQAPTPAAAVISSGNFVEAHGGLVATLVLLVFAAQALLTALRTVLLKFDGIAEGQDIPPANTTLTLVNKICIVLGTILDFLQGNAKH